MAYSEDPSNEETLGNKKFTTGLILFL